MKKLCFILASTTGRTHMLNRCVSCAKRSNYSQEDYYLYFQGEGIEEIEDRSFFKEIVHDKELRGVFTPRYELMKKYCLEYEFTIIIDDDLYLKPETSFENAIDFLQAVPYAGSVCLSLHFSKYRNLMDCVSDKKGYYNIKGGLVLPKKSVQIILDYFKDKEKDYTEDMFWLLLYIKGYDLYQDYSSNTIHVCERRDIDGNPTGYLKMRLEKDHLPMLEEWFDSKKILYKKHKCYLYEDKELKHINANGVQERLKNRKKLELTLGRN